MDRDKDIRESWATHREEMREEFQQRQETGRGMTVEEALLFARRSFKAGANAMADAIHAESLRRDLAAAQEIEARDNIIPLSVA